MSLSRKFLYLFSVMVLVGMLLPRQARSDDFDFYDYSDDISWDTWFDAPPFDTTFYFDNSIQSDTEFDQMDLELLFVDQPDYSSAFDLIQSDPVLSDVFGWYYYDPAVLTPGDVFTPFEDPIWQDDSAFMDFLLGQDFTNQDPNLTVTPAPPAFTVTATPVFTPLPGPAPTPTFAETETPVPTNYNGGDTQCPTDKEKELEPIYTNDGTLIFSVADFSYARPGYALRYERYYDPRQTSMQNELGSSWMSNYDNAIQLNPDATVATLYVPNSAFTYTRTAGASQFNTPPAAFSSLQQLNSVPSDLAGHPNLTGEFSLKSLYLLTDKFGNVTYYAAFSPGPGNLCKPLLEKDRNGHQLRYVYEGYNDGQLTAGVNTINNRLRRVEASPVTWALDFYYYTGFQDAGPGTVDHCLRSVVSSAGDFIQFTLPGGDVRVTRGTLSDPLGGFPALYHYENDVNGHPVVMRRDDPLAVKGDKHMSYDYQRDNFGAINGGINTAYNGRGQVMLRLEYPNPIPAGPYSTLVRRGNTPKRRDYYDGSASRQLLTSDVYLDASTYSQVYEYNADGLPTMVKDGQDNTVKMTYDNLGNLLTRHTAASLNDEIFTYDGASRVQTHTDRRSRTTQFHYDGQGNLTSIEEPENKTTTYTYYPGGQVQTITESVDSSTNRTTTFTYDNNGYPQTIQEPPVTALSGAMVSGPVTSYSYDAKGRLGSRTDPDAGAGSKTTYFVWNTKNQKTDIYFPDGGNNHFEYDANGNLRRFVDANQKVTRYFYDDDDNLVDVWQAQGTADQVRTHYEYDEQSNRTSVTEDFDGTAQKTIFSYNQQDLMKSQEGEDHHPVTFTYDNANNLFTRLDSKGQGTFFYDPDHRLKSASYADVSFSFTYDDNGNRLSMTDAAGIKTYDNYDGLNRLTQMTDHGTNTVFTYSYDRVGDRLSLHNSRQPSGQPITYQYYENGQLKSVTDQDGDKTTYAYDALKRPIATVLPGSIAHTSYTYFPNSGRLASVTNLNATGEILSRFAYTYDFVGNIQKETNLAGDVVYGYDNRYQLTSAAYPGPQGTSTYGYDALGNRNAINAQSAAYNRSNEITSLGTLGFGSDNNGNMTQKGTRAYVWDAVNRLKEVNTTGGGAVLADYVYNADNQRVQKTSGAGLVTKYLYDMSAVQMELDGTNAVLRQYVPGISETRKDRSKFYYLYNGHGDVADLIDRNGNIVQTYSYDALGTVVGLAGDPNAFRYAGNASVFSDDDAGLQYMLNRWYDPQLGRFISRDPSGISGGLNLYAYLGNNPLLGADPSGLCKSWDQKLAEGYYYGTYAGESSAKWWADQYVATNNLVYAVGGAFASLWTPDTYQSTAWTLITAASLGEMASPSGYSRYVSGGGNPEGPWLTSGPEAPYGENFELAKDQLQLPNTPTSVGPVEVPWYEPVAGPRTVGELHPDWGTGGGVEYYRGSLFFPE